MGITCLASTNVFGMLVYSNPPERYLNLQGDAGAKQEIMGGGKKKKKKKKTI